MSNKRFICQSRIKHGRKRHAAGDPISLDPDSADARRLLSKGRIAAPEPDPHSQDSGKGSGDSGGQAPTAAGAKGADTGTTDGGKGGKTAADAK